MVAEGHVHLLVVATNFSETRGGVEAHLESLLPRLVDRGVAVTIVYLGTRRPPRTEGGVRVIALSRWFDLQNVIGVPRPAEWRHFRRAVAGGQAGPRRVTHVATHTRFFPMSWLGVRLAARLGVPVLHTEHGAGFVSTSSRLVEIASWLIDHVMGRAVLRGADQVIAVSEATRAFVRDLAGVDSVRINNGVDVATWLAAPDAGPAERSLVFVGRLVREKGWRTFLDICATCRERGFRGPIVVLGDGPEREQLEAYAARLGLDGVNALGHVPPATIRQVLHGAVYVNPSTAAEGFQMTLVEGLVAGAAVVSYDVGCAGELAAVPEFDVSVVAKGDASALEAATLAALERPVRPAPRELLLEWDWELVADRYVDLLRASGRAVR